jgi:hypothetical protein
MLHQPMLAAMLGGWEIVLILAVIGILGLAFIAAVIFIAVCYCRNQRRVPPVDSRAGGTSRT